MNPSDSSVPEITPTPVSNQPNISTQPAISTAVITRMNVKVFKAAQEGNVEALTEHRDRLHQMLTPTESTVLHVYIASLDSALLTKSKASVKKSAEVVTKMLIICQQLLLLPNKHGDTALHFAARHGRAEIIQVLMQAAEDWRGDLGEGSTSTCQQFLIRKTNKAKNTALHEAVRFNHFDIVKILIEKDPEFEYPANDAGETPLFIAAERGYSNLVFTILDTCTIPSYEGPDGRTALHIAAAYGHLQITGRLLEKEKTLALAADGKGYTPLHFASFMGYVSIVKQILECDDSTAYIGSNEKRTPAHLAAQMGRVGVLEQLLLYCPDCFELVDCDGWNALHHAISKNRDNVEEFVRKDPWLCSFLLNCKNSDGNTPLHLIINSDQKYNGLKFIRDSRVDMMAFDNDNMTALDLIHLHPDSKWKRDLTDALKDSGARYGQRLTKKKVEDNQVEAKKRDKDSSQDSKHKGRKLSDFVPSVELSLGFDI